MNTKQNRILEISQIIETEVVRSQQDIIAKLGERGMDITQASLSRYLKEIQASRIPDGEGGYIYKLPSSAEQQQSKGIASEIMSVEFAGPSIMVIRTGGGFANAVSAMIDSRSLTCFAGTVSGDDTIIIAIRDGYTRIQVRHMLSTEFPYIKDKFLNE
ncbi:MAG: ArgR family transcriptional regulator [Bacteroidales bacterium]|nr:ArgR family transcriptional regulator [Bacteroidales bacterium]